MKNNIKLNVDEQQNAIKHLKEYFDRDDKEPPWKDEAVCKTCNQSFAWKKWLEKHIQENALSFCEIIVANCLKKEKSNQSNG